MEDAKPSIKTTILTYIEAASSLNCHWLLMPTFCHYAFLRLHPSCFKVAAKQNIGEHLNDRYINQNDLGKASLRIITLAGFLNFCFVMCFAGTYYDDTACQLPRPLRSMWIHIHAAWMENPVWVLSRRTRWRNSICLWGLLISAADPRMAVSWQKYFNVMYCLVEFSFS